MKIKNINLELVEEDILKFLELQDKLKIEKVKINDEIVIEGRFNFKGFNLKFQLELAIINVKDNIVFINLINLKLLNINIINAISKKAINYIINSFTSIEGIYFKEELLRISVRDIISKFYKDELPISLNNLTLEKVKTFNDKIELELKDIDVDTNKVVSDFAKDEKIEEDIIDVNL